MNTIPPTIDKRILAEAPYKWGNYPQKMLEHHYPGIICHVIGSYRQYGGDPPYTKRLSSFIEQVGKHSNTFSDHMFYLSGYSFWSGKNPHAHQDVACLIAPYENPDKIEAFYLNEWPELFLEETPFVYDWGRERNATNHSGSCYAITLRAGVETFGSTAYNRSIYGQARLCRGNFSHREPVELPTVSIARLQQRPKPSLRLIHGV